MTPQITPNHLLANNTGYEYTRNQELPGRAEFAEKQVNRYRLALAFVAGDIDQFQPRI